MKARLDREEGKGTPHVTYPAVWGVQLGKPPHQIRLQTGGDHAHHSIHHESLKDSTESWNCTLWKKEQPTANRSAVHNHTSLLQYSTYICTVYKPQDFNLTKVKCSTFTTIPCEPNAEPAKWRELAVNVMLNQPCSI